MGRFRFPVEAEASQFRGAEYHLSSCSGSESAVAYTMVLDITGEEGEDVTGGLGEDEEREASLESGIKTHIKS